MTSPLGVSFPIHNKKLSDAPVSFRCFTRFLLSATGRQLNLPPPEVPPPEQFRFLRIE